MPSAAVIFADREIREGISVFGVCVGSVWLNCHFFTVDEIEFDLDPRDVSSAADFAALLHFMQGLGQAVNRPVLLTTEGWTEDNSISEKPIFTYKPQTNTLDYEPHGGYITPLRAVPPIYDMPMETP